MERADAGRRRDPRGAANSFRRSPAAEESGRIFAEGLRRAGRNHGARRRHEAHAGKQERADRAGVRPNAVIARLDRAHTKKGPHRWGPVCIRWRIHAAVKAKREENGGCARDPVNLSRAYITSKLLINSSRDLARPNNALFV